MGCTPSYAASKVEDKAYQGPSEGGPPRVVFEDLEEEEEANRARHYQVVKEPTPRATTTKWSLIRSLKQQGGRPLEGSAVTLRMDKQFLVDAFVRMVISDGQPFEVVSGSGMRMLVGPLCEALGVSLDEENLKKEVAGRAQRIRLTICQDVSEKMVSVTISVICRLSRSFVGVSVHYVKRNRKQFRTLGLREISSVHNAREVKRVVLYLLSNYGIGRQLIYTITINNGVNPLKAFPAGQNKVNNDDSDEDNEEEEDDGDRETSAAITASLRDVFFSDKETDREHMPCASANSDCLVNIIKTMSQCVLTSNPDAKKMIEKARTVSNKLATKSVIAILKSKGTKLPIVETRPNWKSTYAMVKRLGNKGLKQVINEMGVFSPDLNISLTEWDRMRMFIEAFQPLFALCSQLRGADLTAGEFYRDWLKSKMETQKIDSDFARALVEHMKKAEAKMMKNKAFLAGVYLDPRIRIALNEEQIVNARQHLEGVWRALRSVKNKAPTPDVSCDEKREPEAPLEDILESFLRSQDQNQNNSKTGSFLLTSNFKTYETKPREKFSADVIQFWEKYAQESPELHQLAEIVMAYPITEAGSERVWSGVQFLLNATKTNLPLDVVEDIILIKTNKMFYGTCTKQ